MRPWLPLLLLALMGCPAGPGDDDDFAPSDDDDSAATDDDDDSSSVADDDDSAQPDDDDAADDDDTPWVVDCAALPAAPLSERILDGARGYHGLAFDGSGRIVGNAVQALIRSTYAGDAEVWVPGIGDLEGMDSLPGGDLVVSAGASGELWRVTPEGGQSLVLADAHAYTVLTGPLGRIWASGGLGIVDTNVVRIDPDTGERETITSVPPGGEPRSLNFSPDLSRLYIGTEGGYETGRIYVVELDDELNPTGPAEVFAEGVGDGWLDGIAVDACGNLYVPDSWSLGLYRITPDGDVSLYLDWSADEGLYGHGAIFGSGIGGWRPDALYMPLSYGGDRVKELVIGVPSRTFDGEVLNGP